MEALAAFSSSLANGECGQDCMQLFTATRLVPLPKKGDGVHPVAVGDFLRRMAAKCAPEVVLEEIVPLPLLPLLVPLQVGVQVFNATDLFVIRIQLWTAEAPEGSALLQGDMKMLLTRWTGQQW